MTGTEVAILISSVVCLVACYEWFRGGFMGLYYVLRRYLNKAPALNDIGKRYAPPLSDGERLWNQLIRHKGCVMCHVQPKGFAEGPSGGISTNIFCIRCGQGYNITPMVHTAELIRVDVSYIEGKKP